MNVLQVVDAVPPGDGEPQDDPFAWIARANKNTGAHLYLLLQGDAVRCALKTPHDGARLRELSQRDIKIYVVSDDATDRGISLADLAPNVEPIARTEVPALYARHDQIWLW